MNTYKIRPTFRPTFKHMLSNVSGRIAGAEEEFFGLSTDQD